MKLEFLLQNLEISSSKNLQLDSEVSSLAFDSRNVQANSLFIAARGTQVDGHNFIAKAIEQGARSIVCENLPDTLVAGVSYLVVDNSHRALGRIAANFYGRPSESIKVVGITGTNGKTSTATMLYELFTLLGHKVGLISTIQIRIEKDVIPSTHTTPDALSIQKTLRAMADRGCDYCFMEVSSHAIDQHRIAGIAYAGAVFTNITHDHLDYHLTFQNYLQAKKKFFDFLPNAAFAITNLDDRNGKVMLQNTQARKKTFAMHSLADYNVKILESGMGGMLIKINGHDVHVQLVGEFNAYNLLACYAVAIELGYHTDEVLLQMTKLMPVEGRLEIVQTKNTKVRGVVDYAHTPDAVEKLLVEITKVKNKGKIITVIGCGGNRDKDKRPVMAKLAAQYSDRVLLTSDNPRNEDPRDIIQEMKAGLDDKDLKKTLVVIDRAEAIKTACLLAEDEDIIALLGKGHEKYQEIKGEKIPFDDKVLLKEGMEIIVNE